MLNVSSHVVANEKVKYWCASSAGPVDSQALMRTDGKMILVIAKESICQIEGDGREKPSITLQKCIGVAHNYDPKAVVTTVFHATCKGVLPQDPQGKEGYFINTIKSVDFGKSLFENHVLGRGQYEGYEAKGTMQCLTGRIITENKADRCLGEFTLITPMLK